MKLKRSIVLFIVLAGMLSIAAAHACVESRGFEEDEGFLYMKFHSECSVPRNIIVCVRWDEDKFTRPGGQIKPAGNITINLGRDVPDQTLYWTYDGSDPCENWQ